MSATTKQVQEEEDKNVTKGKHLLMPAVNRWNAISSDEDESESEAS